jgi:integrase
MRVLASGYFSLTFEYSVNIITSSGKALKMIASMETEQTKVSIASIGLVGIEEFRNKLRLRLPRGISGSKNRYISTGLQATPENWKKAQVKAWEIEQDISNGHFDSTLAKYKLKSHLTLIKSVDKPQDILTLYELWECYTDYKSKLIESTTIKTTYKRTKNLIPLFPTQDLKEAVAIRDWLLANKSAYTAKCVLIHLSGCCEWAVESRLIASNPFAKMAQTIQQTDEDGEDIDPFTVQERDAIIAGFENSRYYKHYTNFVRFLFLTGCRTGEAIALKWKHINPEMTQITFCESFSSHFSLRKDTKNHQSRKFPINAQLKALLESIKGKACNPEDLVFPSPTGREIDGHNFLNRAWKGYKNRHGNQVDGIVTQLVKEGKVERYRCQYNTRHTFVTMALEANVSIPQLAKWVGNSPEVIMKHYAGTLRQVQVPEF